MDKKTYPFIDYLESLRDSKDERAAFAALRRGLGRSPGTEPAMFPYIARWITQDTSQWYETTLYTIASLFAYHPKQGGTGNLGKAFKQAASKENDTTALERRFTALLAADSEDLDFYLRQAVSFLKSKDIAIDWQQLFGDVLAWRHPDRYIQRTWAYAFWGQERQSDESKSAT